MFSVTFNNISVISWRPVLLVEETRVPGENHRPVRSLCLVTNQINITFYCKIMVYYINHYRLSKPTSVEVTRFCFDRIFS